MGQMYIRAEDELREQGYTAVITSALRDAGVRHTVVRSSTLVRSSHCDAFVRGYWVRVTGRAPGGDRLEILCLHNGHAVRFMPVGEQHSDKRAWPPARFSAAAVAVIAKRFQTFGDGDADMWRLLFAPDLTAETERAWQIRRDAEAREFFAAVEREHARVTHVYTRRPRGRGHRGGGVWTAVHPDRPGRVYPSARDAVFDVLTHQG